MKAEDLTPRCAPVLYGHTEAFADFRRLFETSRLPHAWLVSGLAGIGKETFAFHCIRLLLGLASDRKAFQRFEAGTHGNLLEVRRETDPRTRLRRTEITVGQVRAIRNFLQYTAGDGQWRAVLIEEADLLNKAAANALLKFVEEPPPFTVIFLLTTAPGSLLPTLRSRCRKIALRPLSDAEMRMCFPGVSEEALLAARGRPGVLLRSTGEGRARLENWLKEEGDALSVPEALPPEVKKLIQDSEGFSLLCELLEERLVMRALAAAQGGDLAQARFWADQKLKMHILRNRTIHLTLDRDQNLREAFALLKN